MLTDKLREGAQGRIFKVLFWIIILSFIFAGVGNYLIPRLNTDPVEIGKYRISSNEWTEQYNQRTQMLMRMYGSQAQVLLENPQFVKNLRMQVLDDMINNVALNSQTFDNGIRIGDEQVKDEIRKDPRFAKDGKFNNDLFLASVRNIGSSPDYYAEQLRTSLMTSSLVTPIISASAVPLPYELDALAKLFAQSRTVNLYSLDPASLKDKVSLTDNDVQSYYDAHHDEFMKPENATFSYVVLSVDELKKSVETDDEKLSEYYRLNQDEFTVAQKREASQILIKPSNEMQQKAQEAINALSSGEDFAAVAAKYSEDPDFATSHGSLGTLEKGSLSALLDKALFDLQNVGDVSAVVYDDYGAHILRLDGIIAAHVPDFAEIKDNVKERYVEAQALAMYNDKSATLTDLAFENPDSLDAAADAIGVSVKQSGVVNLGDTTLAWPLNNSDLQRAVFNEENRSSHVNSNVISLGENACAVVNVSEYHESMLQKFDEVKDKARELALNTKIQSLANTVLADFAKALSSDPKVALPENVILKENVVFNHSRLDQNSDINFVQDVFAIVSKSGDYVVSVNKGIPTLAVLKEISLDKDNSLDNYANFIRPQIVQYKQESTQNMLYLGARALSEITYNDEAINLVNQQDNSSE